MRCVNCNNDVSSLVYHKDHIGWCWNCHNLTKGSPFGLSSMIATDSIEGGMEIKHGICNEDGSPKKYYSKSEIKRAAYEKGLFIIGDTPKVPAHLIESRQRARENPS